MNWNYKMQTVTFLNHKGGVGKTSLSVLVACGLAAKGLRVMLVDSDPQGHASVALGVEKSPNFYDLLVRGKPYGECLTVIPPERYMRNGKSIPSSQAGLKINGEVVDEQPEQQGVLYLLAGNEETAGIDMMKNVSVIRRRFADMNQDVDVIVVDTSPSPTQLHAGIYMATDHIVYVTEAELLAFDGLKSSLTYIEPANQFRFDNGITQINVMGIVVNKYREGTTQHPENLKSMQEMYGDYIWDPIAMRIAWSDVNMLGIPVYNYIDKQATSEAWGLINRVYNNLKVTA